MAIENTADLRKVLADTIEGVIKGSINPQQAQAVSSLSGKILQTAKLEFDVLRSLKGAPLESVNELPSVLQIGSRRITAIAPSNQNGAVVADKAPVTARALESIRRSEEVKKDGPMPPGEAELVEFSGDPKEDLTILIENAAMSVSNRMAVMTHYKLGEAQFRELMNQIVDERSDAKRATVKN